MEKNSEIKVKQCEREKTEIRKCKNGIDQQKRLGKKKQRTKITQCENYETKIGKWKNKRDKQEKGKGEGQPDLRI